MAQLELHLDSEVWKVSPSFPLYEVSGIIYLTEQH